MKKGDLLSLLRNDKNISLETLFQMARQAAAGMVYLEDRNIIHRDLALRKINSDLSVCLNFSRKFLGYVWR